MKVRSFLLHVLMTLFVVSVCNASHIDFCSSIKQKTAALDLTGIRHLLAQGKNLGSIKDDIPIVMDILKSRLGPGTLEQIGKITHLFLSYGLVPENPQFRIMCGLPIAKDLKLSDSEKAECLIMSCITGNADPDQFISKDLDFSKSRIKNPLHAACSFANQHAIQKLIDKKYQLTPDLPALIVSCSFSGLIRDYEQCLHILDSYGADFGQSWQLVQQLLDRPPFTHQYNEIIAFLLHKAPFITEDNKKRAFNVLVQACNVGNPDIVFMLLDMGISPEPRNGISPLLAACSAPELEYWERLSRLSWNDANLELIRSYTGINVSPKNKYEFREKFYYFFRRKYLDIVLQILTFSSNIEHADQWGRTPLLYTALTGKREISRLLLYKGADQSLCDKLGQDIYTYACMAPDHDAPLLKKLKPNGEIMPALIDPEAVLHAITDLLIHWNPEQFLCIYYDPQVETIGRKLSAVNGYYRNLFQLNFIDSQPVSLSNVKWHHKNANSAAVTFDVESNGEILAHMIGSFTKPGNCWKLLHLARNRNALSSD